MFKKSHFVSYMTDVRGYGLEEAAAIWQDIGGCVEEVLSHSEVEEMAEFNDLKVRFGDTDEHFMTNYAIVK